MSGALAAALVKAQQDMPAVEKTGKSNFGAHITLDHLIASTRKHLAKHGLTVAQFPCVLETGQPGLRTMLMHESGETLSADAPLFLGERHTMQALGAALTYARRQGWSSVLGISTEDDDDADSISKPAEKSRGKSETGAAPKATTPPPAGVPDTAREEALLKLVEAKGGDVDKTRAGLETAREQGKLDVWLPGAEDYWGKQPDSYANRIPDAAKTEVAA